MIRAYKFVYVSWSVSVFSVYLVTKRRSKRFNESSSIVHIIHLQYIMSSFKGYEINDSLELTYNM